MTEHIQVGDVLPRVQYVADGVQTAFSYSFPIFTAADLAVYVGTTLQTSGFSVSGAGVSAGGSVLFTVPPAMGALVTLRRSLAIQRTTDLQADGIIRAKTLNDEFDYQTAALQQVAEDSGRAVRRAITSNSTADLTLPEPAALMALKWNAAGTGLENSATDLDQAATSASASAAAAAASAVAAALSATNAASDALPDATGEGGHFLRQKAAEDGLEYRAATEVRGDIGLGTAAVLDIDTDAALAADSDSRIPSQKAVKAYVAATATASARLDLLDGNIGLLFLSVARLTTSTAPEQGGQEVADEFDDTTGIGSLGGATVGGGCVSNAGGTGSIPLGGLTITTEHAGSGSTANMTDGNTGTYFSPSPSGSAYWIGYDLGASNTYAITSYDYRTGGGDVGGLTSIVLKASSTGAFAGEEVTLDTWASSWTGGTTYNRPVTNSTVYRYLRWCHTTVGATYSPYIYELIPKGTASSANIATVSTAYTASSLPTTVTLVGIWKDIAGSSAVNTDVVFQVSRDGGTTWTAVTMADFGPGPVSGSRVLKGSADVSGQPSGTSLKWKVETANAREQQVHGIWMQWR